MHNEIMAQKQAFAAQTMGAVYHGETTTAAAQSASELILSRLNGIRTNLMEARGSIDHAANKIVGAAPTPISTAGSSLGQIKGDQPPASCFLDALQQVIGDIERAGSDVHEHLNRIHRHF